jgi:DNA-binding NarL/FixJ family response regulator
MDYFCRSLTDNDMIRVLIVEDSDLVRDRISRALMELSNVEIVGEAVNAKDAVRLGALHKPNVIILDIKLQGDYNGLFALEELKAAHPFIKTIVFTNFPEAAYKNKALELGADYFFDKSKEFDNVIKLFKRA